MSNGESRQESLANPKMGRRRTSCRIMATRHDRGIHPTDDVGERVRLLALSICNEHCSQSERTPDVKASHAVDRVSSVD